LADEELKVRISTDTEDSKAAISDMDGLFSGLGDTVKGFALGAAASLAAFTIAMGVKGVNAASELEKAVNDVTTQTGAGKKEMGGFRDILTDLYAQNFGESFEDLGKSLAEVKKQTKLSGTELENFTKNALILRDTFEFEVTESTRAAKQMMDQFGISGDDAFNLIAQGAQKGLNKNDDLLDSINEYSVQFKSIGLDADDMFEMFGAGAESGAFSIDKIGDAIKEFNIRSKDMSKGSAEGFKALGLNADNMFKKFAGGGAKAQEAFFQVIQKLGAIKDKTKQNAVGVALFGAQFEDLEAQGILALGNLGNEFDQTKKTMDSINQIRYNTFGEAMAGIGRQIEVGLLIPFGQLLLPMLNKFSSWIATALPGAIAIFKQIAAFISSVFGPVFAESFANIKLALGNFVTGVQGSGASATPIFTALKDLFRTLANTWKIYSDIVTKQVLPAFLTVVGQLLPVLGAIFFGIIKALQGVYVVWGVIWGAVGGLVGQIFKQIATVVTANMNIIKAIISIVSGLIKGDWSMVWNGIKTIIKNAFSIIKGVIKTGLTMWKSIFSLMLGLIKIAVQNGFIVLKNLIKLQIQLSVSIIKNALTLMVNTFKSKGANIKSAMSSVLNYIKNALANLGKQAYSWGSNFLKAFTNGIKSRIAALKNMVKSAAQQLKNMLGFSSPTKEGPGRTAHKWGPNFVKMFAAGIAKNINLVKRASNTTALALAPARIPTSVGGSNFSNVINITGNSIVNEALVEAIMNKAIRLMANRGR